ncbi:aphid transmission factor [Lamium leaf distortion virus]|uniref:Aphid transmission protein n=1 Tax=Lamium leaf distortion virus TaxID=515320 RepID=B2CXY2_9VIRU|nr:aphid transmission factor [Lamium leaf distortion virus]ACB69764.1 aphid transmission factor [Lamium leaf distortion virus]
MSITSKSHIYKKGTTIIPLKNLAINTDGKKYVFNSLKPNIQSVVNHCNNLNEVCGRILLGIWKLCSYFGLSKDPSEPHSKNPSVYDHAKTIFKSGGVDHSVILREIKSLIETQQTKNKNLENKIDNLEKSIKDLSHKIEPEPLTHEKIKDFSNALKAIDDKLKNVIGE